MTSPMPAIAHSSRRDARRANVITMPQRTFSPPPPPPAPQKGKESKKKKTLLPGEIDAEIPTKNVPEIDDFGRLAPGAIRVYKNAEGDVIYAVLECEDEKKAIVYGVKDGRAGWHVVDNDFLNKKLPKRPLYGLDKIARCSSLPILLVGNEDVSDKLQEQLEGYVVAAFAPENLHRMDWSHLRDRAVILWPSASPAGQRGAVDTARAIDRDQAADATAPRVRIVQIPGGSLSSVDLTALVEGAIEPSAQEGKNNEPEAIFPSHYIMTTSGLVFSQPSHREGQPGVEIEVTTRPFEVISAVDTRSAADAGLLLRWKNDQGHVREFVAPKGEISNIKSDLFSRMAKLGFGFNPAQAQHLRTFFMKIYCNGFTQIVDKVGWSESSKGVFDTFIVPGGDVLNSGDERIIFKNDNVDMEALSALHAPAGTLTDWQEGIAAYAQGNSRLAFTIAAAFASPLLPLLKAPGGGFHFFGRSSRGKTTMLTVGASVWGDTNDPGSTIIKKWKSTANAMEGLLERVSETCAFLDESTNAPGRTVGDIVYLASDGEGKNRATREVGLRKGKTFRLIFVSSGEKSLSDQIAADSGAIQGGQDARMPSIHALVSETNGAFDDIRGFDDPAAFSKYLTGKCKECHGVAGRHFIKELMREIKDKGQEYIVDLISGQIAQFREKYVRPGIDGQVERVADRFALVSAAGEMAIWLGVLPWGEGEAMAEIGRVYEDWIDSRGGDGSREDINLIKALREFLMRHGLRRFDSLRRIETAGAGGREGTADDFVSNVVDRIGFREQVSANNNDAVFYDYVIPAATWDSFIRDELKATSMTGIDAAKAIRDAGFLKVGSRGMTVKRTLLTVGKQVRCYTILHTIMKDDNEDADD